MTFINPKGKVTDKIIPDSIENLKYSSLSLSIKIDNDGGTKGAMTWEEATFLDWCHGTGNLNDPYIIEHLEIDAINQNSGISILDSDVYFIIRNCTIYNSSSTEAGIKLINTNNGLIFNNNISYNIGSGISMSNSDDNSIENNILNNNKFGIYLANNSQGNNIINNNVIDNLNDGINFDGIEQIVSFNNIKENYVCRSGNDGIVFHQSYSNSIYNNTIYNNSNIGIIINASGNNTISENTIIQHNTDGIRLFSNSSDNIISLNEIRNSERDGLRIDLGSDNKITGNKLLNNTESGISIYEDTCQNNIVYNNNFTGNDINNALDNGYNSLWDYNNLGNYWDDYQGIDENDDGIGDTPYSIPGIAGTKDHFPIWEDESQESYKFCTTIVINEIFAGYPDWIEMYNYGPDRDMTGWYMRIYDDNELTLTYRFPNNWIFKSSYVVTLHELSSNPDTENNLYTTLNILWHDRPIAVGLFDDNNISIDWFQTSTHIGFIPSGNIWEQDISMVIDQNDAFRTHDIDNNKASDWSISDSGSQGNLNPGQSGEGYPSFHNLTRSEDPLELGNTEIITIDVYDLKGISQVQIEINGNLHLMEKVDDFTWQYGSWTPSSTGNKSYTIFGENIRNNINSIVDSIEVIDTIPPVYNYIHESTDPLELGNTEVITISVSDLSDIYQVLLEFGGINQSMSYIGGNEWRYSTWTPSNTGTYNYTIYFEDNNHNWNSITESITVIDNIPPSYSNLIESADPLELGATETISINVYDSVGINQVLIEIEEVNYTMTNIGAEIWQYNNWTPSSTGTYFYTIYMEDLDDNWNSVTESITVIDTIPPSYSNLVESADPLELGATEMISINVYDSVGINQVLIEIEEVNYTMTNIGAEIWQYNNWTPSSTGTYFYTIYMEDLDDNWNFVTESITVIDIIPPSYSNLIESADPLELGATEMISINVYDNVGINQVLIEIEEINYTMTNIGGETWQYDNWTPSNIGTYLYTIYMEDMDNNRISVVESIIVIDTTPPEIIIYEPDSYDQFGIIPPQVYVEFFDYDLDTVWYQLTDGSQSKNYIWFGNIDQNGWEIFGTGLVTITFFANDSAGNLGYTSVIIRKDIIAPDITINEPNPYDLFGRKVPNVDIEIEAQDLDTIWYILFNSTQSIIDFTWTGSIEQVIWDEFNSGILTIRFYVNDTLGNTRFLDVSIIKDVSPPDLIFYEPNPFDLFGVTPPRMDIYVFDDNLDDVWYQLSNGLTNTKNYTWTGILEQGVWDEVGNGTLTIILYANDTLSNFAIQSVIVRKDIIAPLIFIDYPVNYTVFGNNPPNIAITVDEPNLDKMWYQINNGTILIGNYSWEGILHQGVWDELGNGTLTIIFYSNDTIGNLGSKILIIRKDIIAPKIIIEKPEPYSLFGKSPPIINMEFYDPHLFYRWYQLKNGTIATNNLTWTGIIEQSIWNLFGNGTIIITFYANDFLGNLGIESLLVYKDIISPKIVIIHPNPYDVFGESAPDININIDDKNLNCTWYQLKNRTFSTLNYTWRGVLEQDVWAQIGNGSVTIIFYANDIMGNLAYTEITILKDLSAPIINIIDPEEFAIFGTTTPNFKVYISGVDINSCWYLFLDNSQKFFFIEVVGINTIIIDQTAWDEFGNGTVTLKFYINDSVGNIGFDSVELRKDIFAPEVIINLPIYEGYYNSPPLLNISFSDPNQDSLWYEIGSFYGSLITNTKQGIDSLIWDSLEQGKHRLFIYANDTLGNVNNTYEFIIYKDTLAPIISINSPVDGSTSNSPPVLNITCIDPNFDALWYGDGMTNITLVNNTDQALNLEIWNTLPEGIYHIFIYANDTFGHFNNIQVLTLYKDTKAPTITINEPYNNTYINNPPFLSLIASDPNLDTLWYRIGLYEIKIIEVNQMIDPTIWDKLEQGKFQINIFANDTLGNINNTYSLTLYKDTLPPHIVINAPLNLSFWNSRPFLNITVFDPNLESIYYKVGSYTWWLNNNTQARFSLIIWQSLAEGEFEIQFFAKDLAGNINNSFTLILNKDTLAPDIIINYPYSNSIRGIKAPIFNISINEINLDRVWYTLVGYSEEYIVEEISGTINQIAWEKFGNGTVIIRFYANDTLGNLKIEEVIVRKDIYTPIIKVSLPINRTVWDSPPIIDISVSDSNLEYIWYRIGTTTTNIINDVEQLIDTLIWDSLFQGEFYLYIYANDSAGNINDSFCIILYKDTLAPNITINVPNEDDDITRKAPYFNITIIENNLDTCWYTLDMGMTNITFKDRIGQINQTLWEIYWDPLANGDTITIRFYANDTLGHIGNQEVVVKVYKPSKTQDFLFRTSGLIIAGAVLGILGLTTTTMKKIPKYKRLDNNQKKKINAILYLSITLITLMFIASFI